MTRDEKRARKHHLVAFLQKKKAEVEEGIREIALAEKELHLLGSLEARVLDVLRCAEAPLSPMQVYIRLVGDDLHQIQTVLSKLSKADLVFRVRYGLYEL